MNEPRLLSPQDTASMPPAFDRDVLVAHFAAMQSQTIVNMDDTLKHYLKELRDLHERYGTLHNLHEDCMTIAKGGRPKARPSRLAGLGYPYDRDLPQAEYHDDMNVIATLRNALHDEKGNSARTEEARTNLAGQLNSLTDAHRKLLRKQARQTPARRRR